MAIGGGLGFQSVKHGNGNRHRNSEGVLTHYSLDILEQSGR